VRAGVGSDDGAGSLALRVAVTGETLSDGWLCEVAYMGASQEYISSTAGRVQAFADWVESHSAPGLTRCE
jgi:hypothetical protein